MACVIWWENGFKKNWNVLSRIENCHGRVVVVIKLYKSYSHFSKLQAPSFFLGEGRENGKKKKKVSCASSNISKGKNQSSPSNLDRANKLSWQETPLQLDAKIPSFLPPAGCFVVDSNLEPSALSALIIPPSVSSPDDCFSRSASALSATCLPIIFCS